MTDSSSNEPMADIAADLMAAKMDVQKMTHLLRVGTFQMEINPSDDVDVRVFFNEILDKLIKAYGEKLLEIDINGVAPQMGGMHG